jgi:hypothetical protein
MDEIPPDMSFRIRVPRTAFLLPPPTRGAPNRGGTPTHSNNSPFSPLPGVPGVPPLKSSREKKVELTPLACRNAQVVPLWGGTHGTPGRAEISEAGEGVSVPPLRAGLWQRGGTGWYR